MEPDNVDVFKKIIFSLPEARTTIAGIWILGVIYSAAMFGALKVFTGIPLSFVTIPFIALFVYILPSLISGELLHTFLPDYPRKWGYFLAASNQLILFTFSVILSGADSIASAWSIIWLGLITVYLSNFFVLILTLGTENIKGISLLSFAQPIAVLVAFHLFLGQYMFIPITTYILNLGLLVVAGGLLAMMLFVVEYLIGSNVSNISAFQLTSGLLQKKQAALDLGYPVDVDVQTLSIENKAGTMNIGIPWVHPGPLGGFGGGSLTSQMIEQLNSDGQGFFLHVPSTHRSDPANPDDNQRIIDAVSSPERIDTASKMIEREYPHATFYGRKFNGKKIIFIDVPDYDDFEVAIFREVIDTEKTVLVDLHQEDMSGAQKEMYYGTAIADRLRDSLKEFIEEVENLETEEYRAGYSVETGEKPFMALVEQVGDQRTLLYGLNGNGLSDSLRETEKELNERFDMVLAFSTDTHTSIHELAKDDHLDRESILNTVNAAENNVSNASVGVGLSTVEKIKLLKDDYNGLIFSINILIRLIPLLLILIYLGLIIWLL